MNKTHFQYNWGWYVAILAAAILLWTSVFSMLEEPADHEKLLVSVFADEVEVELLRTKLDENKGELKKISVDSCGSANTYISVLASARAMASDVVIVEERLLQPGESGEAPVPVEGNFYDFDPAVLRALLGREAELYTVEGKACGVYLTGGNFGDLYKGQGRCVLFFCHGSVNTGGLYGTGEEQNRAAIDLLLYLLEGDHG